jgi:processive 1,2-diacylglycerol beta-glucosyltransferase
MRFAFMNRALFLLRDGTVAVNDIADKRFINFRTGRKRKILLLSVSAGAGHVRAAEAIRSRAEIDHADVQTIHIDVMDFVPAAFRTIYTSLYIALVDSFPTLWGCLYRTMNTADTSSFGQKMRRRVQHFGAGRLLAKIASIAPDAIVCTHFLPAEILAPLVRNGALRCPLWVQVTDFDLHRMWVYQGITGYFAANEEVAFRMRAQGIAAQSIHVAGIPVMPVFAQRYDRAQCAHESGLDPARMTLLLMGGGAGLGRLDQIAEKLMAMNMDFQLIVLAGKNRQLLHALQRVAARYPGRMTAQGYTDRIERLMACADLAITKPGGLTSAECLAMGLPMIVYAPIPGQEERNADFLLEQGAALKASDAETLEYKIRFLLESPDELAGMRNRAKALGRPLAAQKVMTEVLECMR